MRRGWLQSSYELCSRLCPIGMALAYACGMGKLESVTLAGCSIGVAGGLSWAEAIRSNSGLQVFSFSVWLSFYVSMHVPLSTSVRQHSVASILNQRRAECSFVSSIDASHMVSILAGLFIYCAHLYMLWYTLPASSISLIVVIYAFHVVPSLTPSRQQSQFSLHI